MRIFAAVVTIVFVSLFSTAILAEDAGMKVLAVDGKVFVQIAPDDNITPAAVGQILHKNDMIRTEDNGRIYLELPDKTSISVKPGTEISIEELTWDQVGRKTGLNMSSGAMRAMVAKLDSSSEFTVKTPVAICGVRGTIVYLTTTDDQSSLLVEEGLARFTNSISGNSYDVAAGLGSMASIDGNLTNPSALDPTTRNDTVGGYLEPLVAETYTEPGTDTTGGDIVAPDVVQEDQASKV